MSISWSQAFALAVLTFVGFAAVRVLVMTVNDLAYCEGPALACLSRSSVEHRLFDDVGTPPR